MEKEKQELVTVTRLWDEAMVKNDPAEIGGFMADEWVIIGSDGITSKSGFLKWISSGRVSHNRMDADELIINVYGDTGIVVGRGTSAGIFEGQSFSLYEWSTSIFIRTNGVWLCVLTMLTPANKVNKE
ncbi:MAG: nuclear transport factor 2 family protein [Ferruginibacter sp.]|nr:nuclear transport factor 2 family protein [Chitinophagaceae bacterium]